MFIRGRIASNINFALPKSENAKEFVKSVEECSQTIDKYLIETLMTTLTTMKFDSLRTMHKHVIEMTNITTTFMSLGITVDEIFLCSSF